MTKADTEESNMAITQAQLEEIKADAAGGMTIIDLADCDAVFKGTNVEVHRIAALLNGGMKAEEVLEDYPSLSRQQVDVATAWAAAHPKQGRPYPGTSFRRAVRGLGLEALDDEIPAAKS